MRGMAETVRIAPEAHRLLAEMAERLHVPQTEVLSKAIRQYRKMLFIKQLRADFANRTEQEKAEDHEELAAWDGALMDGLEDA